MNRLEPVITDVIDCGFQTHKQLGPGLLESVYETVLAKALHKRGYAVDRQKPVEIQYDNMTFREGFRADIIVNDILLVELKSTERMAPVYGKQVLTYLRLMNLPIGLLMNFGCATFKEGLKRIANNYTPTS